jgi:hypothetical protein
MISDVLRHLLQVKNPVYDLDAALASPAQRIKISVSKKLQSDFVDHGDLQEVSFLIE